MYIILAKTLKKSGDSAKTQEIFSRSDKHKEYFKIMTFICLARVEQLKLFPFFYTKLLQSLRTEVLCSRKGNNFMEKLSKRTTFKT